MNQPDNRNLSPHGWLSDFGQFNTTKKSQILEKLAEFARRELRQEASAQQKQAWDGSVASLKKGFKIAIDVNGKCRYCHAILEYELPLESRRPDVVLLLRNKVAVLEFKSTAGKNSADLDQVGAYARDLGHYHRECHERKILPVLVPMRSGDKQEEQDGINICGPAALDDFIVSEMEETDGNDPIEPHEFLADDSYMPLPSLLAAARSLFNEQNVPEVWRSTANTDQATQAVHAEAIEARGNGKRKLILCTGIPGSGKTLVGLRAVFNKLQEDPGIQDTIYISGNDPLVTCLKHMLSTSEVSGKTFVRRAQDYISKRKGEKTKDRLVVFDEAQRAFDVRAINKAHKNSKDPSENLDKTEAQILLEIMEKKPDWSVVVALIGDGQSIHFGEEGGIKLWVDAVNESRKNGCDWEVTGPDELESVFKNESLSYKKDNRLHLDASLRSHFSLSLHEYVGNLLDKKPPPLNELKEHADILHERSHRLFVTRDLDQAKAYLHRRYQDYKKARYGLVASSRDKDLENHGVKNDYFTVRKTGEKIGHWMLDDDENDSDDKKLPFCRRLEDCVTEFKIQGLELDAVLLAWGTDFRRASDDGSGQLWCNNLARGYKDLIDDPWKLRANSYRVLLTRARDVTVVYMPEVMKVDKETNKECDCLQETYEFLLAAGFRKLDLGDLQTEEKSAP